MDPTREEYEKMGWIFYSANCNSIYKMIDTFEIFIGVNNELPYKNYALRKATTLME